MNLKPLCLFIFKRIERERDVREVIFDNIDVSDFLKKKVKYEVEKSGMGGWD